MEKTQDWSFQKSYIKRKCQNLQIIVRKTALWLKYPKIP